MLTLAVGMLRVMSRDVIEGKSLVTKAAVVEFRDE